MNYTPEQLREWSRQIGMHDYNYASPKKADIEEQLDAHAAKIEECERYRTAMQHWREYWNGSENERAMADALHHIMDGIDAALKESK